MKDEEIKSIVLNYYKSFTIKEGGEDEADSTITEEEEKPQTKVSLGEKCFNEIKKLEKCNVNVGDLIFNLMTQVAEFSPESVEASLPKVMQ